MFNLATRINSRLELVIRGRKDGASRGWLLRRSTGDFQSDRRNEIEPTLASLIAPAAVGNEFTATLVPEGSGKRLALDRDEDGHFDRTELDMGYDPANPASPAALHIAKSAGEIILSWHSASGLRYTVQANTNAVTDSNAWTALSAPLLAVTNVTRYTDAPPVTVPLRLYRLRNEP